MALKKSVTLIWPYPPYVFRHIICLALSNSFLLYYWALSKSYIAQSGQGFSVYFIEILSRYPEHSLYKYTEEVGQILQLLLSHL